jgi:hypothetical protein
MICYDTDRGDDKMIEQRLTTNDRLLHLLKDGKVASPESIMQRALTSASEIGARYIKQFKHGSEATAESLKKHLNEYAYKNNYYKVKYDVYSKDFNKSFQIVIQLHK